MSALTERFSPKISLIVLRDTPSRPANASCVNPIAGISSSRSNSPGWVGGNPFLFSTIVLTFSDNLQGLNRGHRRHQIGMSSYSFQ